MPQERKRDPQNVVDCQFSAHLCIANVLVTGHLGFDDYGPALRDPRVRALMQRIDCYVESLAEAEYPRTFPGLVEITLKDGRKLREFVKTPSGEPETMLSAAQLRAKYALLVTQRLGAAGEATLFDCISRLHEDLPIDQLMRSAQPVTP